MESIINQINKIKVSEWSDEQDMSSSALDYAHDYWRKQTGYSDGDLNGEKKDELYDEFLESFLQDQKEDFFDRFNPRYVNGMLEVFRCIQVPDPDEYMFMLANGEYHLSTLGVDFKGLGIYWTWEEDSAICHWGMGQGEQIVLRGLVDEKSIDAYGTAMANLNVSTNDENEITLKQGADVLLTGIKIDRDWWDVDNAARYVPLVAKLENYPALAKVLATKG